MKILRQRIVPMVIAALFPCAFSACQPHAEHAEAPQHKITVTNPSVRDVDITTDYVCQIHSRQHIKVCAMDGGYIKEIHINEGQAVKKGDVLFRILPVLYEAKLEVELAEAKLAELELHNAERLMQDKVVSPNEVALFQAKLAKARAKAKLADAELSFTNVVAPFDGIVDRLHEQLGSLVKEGEVLTTLSDNSVMWVYFNVPEARYLEYMANGQHGAENQRIELILANGSQFPEPGQIGAVAANFNNETGNIAFRADFPNPHGLLRHGQTGTIRIHRTLKDAIVIPQQATFEILNKHFVFVVGDDGVAHQREVVIEHQLDDIFVIKSGLQLTDKIVLDGVRQVRDGERCEYDVVPAQDALSKLKHHAE